MKRAAWLGGLVLVAFSCDPALSLQDALEGKRCSGEATQCLGGYDCVEGVCVRPQRDSGSAGAAGSMSMAADAGGAGGTESIEAGVDTMSSDVPDAGDADAGCTPVMLFHDLDGDTFGSDTERTKFECPQAGWVTRGGDCFDAEPTADNHAAQVHPEQLEFFAEGYPRPGQPGEVSFDYDCSGEEEASRDVVVAPGDADNCSSASPGTQCGPLGGLLPLARSGGNVNTACGSKTFLICNQQINNQCVPQLQDRSANPLLCH